MLRAAFLKGKTDWLSLTRLGNSLNFLTPKLAIANLKVETQNFKEVEFFVMGRQAIGFAIFSQGLVVKLCVDSFMKPLFWLLNVN